MIEQQVAERFRDAVADEPPLGFDPDDVIDRAIKRRRRRLVTLGVAAATVVEVLVVVALSGRTTDAPGPAAGPAAGQSPTTPPIKLPADATAPGHITATWQTTLSPGQPVASLAADQVVYVADLHVTNPAAAEGTVQLKRNGEVVFEVKLNRMYEHNVRENEAIKFTADHPPTLVLNCTSGANCGAVTMKLDGVDFKEVR